MKSAFVVKRQTGRLGTVLRTSVRFGFPEVSRKLPSKSDRDVRKALRCTKGRLVVGVYVVGFTEPSYSRGLCWESCFVKCKIIAGLFSVFVSLLGSFFFLLVYSTWVRASWSILQILSGARADHGLRLCVSCCSFLVFSADRDVHTVSALIWVLCTSWRPRSCTPEQHTRTSRLHIPIRRTRTSSVINQLKPTVLKPLGTAQSERSGATVCPPGLHPV